MAKTSVSQWDTVANSNTDIGNISLAENVMQPPAVNDAIREMMAQIKAAGFISGVDLGAITAGLTAKTAPVDADAVALADSAASNASKKVTFANLWANFFKGKADALYQPLKTILTSLGNLANGAGVLTNDGSGALTWGAGGPTIGTAQAATSGTTKDFTIPAGTKRVTVSVSDMTVGGNWPGVQLGDAGGIETTGYDGYASRGNGGTAQAVAQIPASAFQTSSAPGNASALINGTLELVLHDAAANTWVASWNLTSSGSSTQASFTTGNGRKSLSQELTTVRLMGGTFSAGKVNVMYS